MNAAQDLVLGEAGGAEAPTGANPLGDGSTVLVAAVGDAEGARGAAAALACAGADLDRPALLVEVGGRPPRPTLLASSAAQRLEQRLAAHLPGLRVAARGQICQLAVPADEDGLAAASAAVTVARGSLAVLLVQPAVFQAVIGGQGPRPTGVLLRADLGSERALVTLVVGRLMTRGLAVAVLKRRLPWVAERRALFGVLPPGQSGGLPKYVCRQLISPPWYLGGDEAAQTGRPSGGGREGHARAGSR
ncbi:MAG TPA: hypothetical protein VF731_09280 [Solirubrobacterales bacterium]